MILAEQAKIVLGAIGLANAGATTGDYVSMKNYNHLTVILAIAPASGTDTAAITMKQATNVGNTLSDEKALTFTSMWKNADNSLTDTLVKTTVASSITTSAVAKSELFVIEIDAADLDVANGFDAVRVDVTDPGAVSTPLCAIYILSQARYAQATPPSAILD